MSRILEATCVGGVVSVGALTVTAAEILSEGVSSSNGALILDEDRVFYVAKTSPDLKSALTQISNALSQIATALTVLDGKPTGTLPPAPAAAGNIAAISAAQSAIATLKEALK